MASSTTNHRRSNKASRSSHTLGSRSSRRGEKIHTTPDHKPLQQRDTGYRVGRGKARSRREGLSDWIRDPRMIIVGIVGIVVAGVMLFGISSCVRGCSASNRAKEKQDKAEEKVNPIDPRVAADADEELTTKLTGVLDLSDAYDDIAKHADELDASLVDLAIAEPEAVPFVRGALEAEATASSYEDALTRGTFPVLYTWDARWGYTSYAEGIAGVTASGPLALSMAAMGLTGSNAQDPSTVMSAVTTDKLASGATGMDDLFVTQHIGEIGLAAEALEVSADSISNAFYAGSSVLLIRTKPSSALGREFAHWALITSLNEDGSYVVHDPTSAIASSHTWAAGTIAAASDTLYAISTADAAAASADEASATDDASYDESYDEGYDEYTDEYSDYQ